LSTDRPKGLPADGPWPEGYDCVVLDQVGSTNAEAMRLCHNFARPTWVFAHRQTAGRGRRGAAWSAPEGNLTVSLAIRPGAHPAWAALRSFLAANALYQTLAMYCDRDALSLKWPNDVLLNGGKVAGILLETSSAGGYVDWLVVGFGVNLRHLPEGVQNAAFPPVSLYAEAGVAPRPLEVLGYLADCYATQERVLDRLGFEEVRAMWLERAARLGEVITARTTREEITGRFDSIDMGGNLILDTPEGRRVIPAADVYF
jgi:BirA family biotin operon repressor/biotin-[acetyl-CoA-carboxylase] ligase